MDSKSARFPRAVSPAGVREARSLPYWGEHVHPAKPTLLFYSGNQDASWGARVVRSSLAQALSTRFRVVVAGDFVAGPVGADASTIQVIPLPPLGSKAAERDRRRILVSSCATLQPRVIVIEQYPFGDLHLGPEILHLLEASTANIRTPLVVSSVRQMPDGDASSCSEVYAARTAADPYFDAVLVHTDPTISRLPEDVLDGDSRWTAPIRYTGFIGADPRGPADTPNQPLVEGGEIVVFGEGGGGHDRLCHVAVDACTYLDAADRLPMRIIAGADMPADDYCSLQKAAAGTAGVVIERTVSDVRSLLGSAAVAVSHCSYPLLDVV